MKQEPSLAEPVVAQVLPWQQATIEQLLRLKQKQQLPHAILIELKTRVDSRSFGWQLVSALLCQNIQADMSPCGKCQHCELMRANNYPDFTFTTLVENERTHKLNKDIKIEQIRHLIHQLSLTPNLTGGKIALIYPAEKMNKSSANSLLKTLEEPADNATLILLTHNAGRLPITIRSRCQVRTVNHPKAEVAKNWLQTKGLEAEAIEQYQEVAHADAQLALQLYEQDFFQYLQAFRDLLKQYLNNRIDVVAVFNSIKERDEEVLRLMIRNTLLSFIYHQLETPLQVSEKNKLLDLINLINHSNFMLQIEENNLNLQLQFEDVLISLKQILNRGKDHGRTQSGDSVAQHKG